jgi:7-cyano-7-deazaguanine synthase
LARIEENVVVLLSGGIDSFACANFYQEQGLQIQSLFVDYGQVAAEMERHSARQIAHIMRYSITDDIMSVVFFFADV